MAQTIAIMNGKGGVGKTTTAINLGTALWILGKRVLMVDTDQQCNLTASIDRTSLGMTSGTLYEWMQDMSFDVEGHDIPVYTKYEGLDYIPSSLQFDSINDYLLNKIRRDDYLNDRLSLIKNNYDYVIIDCNPYIDALINRNVFVAADSLIIPIRTDMFSMQGQSVMNDKITEIRKMCKKPLPVLGYLLTQMENTRIDRDIKNYFKDQEDVPMFHTHIRKCTKCRECINEQCSLFEFNAGSTAADDYMMVAEEITGRRPRPKKFGPKEWSAKARSAYSIFIENQNNEQ